MANSIVRLPYQYFGDPNRGRPLFDADIYIGEPDLDPADIPNNQKTVTARQGDGTEVTIAQPIATNSGGYPVDDSGNTIELLVDGAYSILVLDRQGNQEFYSTNVEEGAPVTFDDTPVFYRSTLSVALADEDMTIGQSVITGGYTTENDGGGAHYVVVAGGTGVDDGGSYIDKTDGSGLQFELVRPSKLNTAIFGVNGSSTDGLQMSRLVEYIDTIGGGEIEYASNVTLDRPIELRTNHYHNLNGFTVSQLDNSGTDIFKTKDFDTLTGVGPLVDAPFNFKVHNGKVDGNYLEDFELAAAGGDTTVNNTAGFGFRLFGSQYSIQVTLDNCAQVGFYSEVVDYTGYGLEQMCSININGRVFGKEAIVYRGPADVEIGPCTVGAVGWLATQAERISTVVMSDIYPTEEVAVMVSDESGVYHGHHEFNFLHLYGNLSGWGYRTEETPRLKGDHMVCENCRGGANFGTRVWGGIAMLECHSNGRQPSDLAGTLTILPDIQNDSLQAFQIISTIRRSKLEAPTYLGYNGTGRNGIVTIDYFSLTDSGTGLPPIGDVANIAGSNNKITINARDVTGDVAYTDCISSDINLIGRGVSGNVLNRFSGETSGNVGNVFTINATDSGNCINLDGLVSFEKINLTANLNTGQTLFSGDSLDVETRAVNIDVSARIDSTISSSRRRGNTNLDNTTTTEQTISVAHGFFQTPDISFVKFGLVDPSPSWTGTLDYLYLQSADASNLTFVYKLGSVGTSGPLVLTWSVEI